MTVTIPSPPSGGAAIVIVTLAVLFLGWPLVGWLIASRLGQRDRGRSA